MTSNKQRVDIKNSGVVKREDYTNTLETIAKGGFCPFCESHLHKHHKLPFIYKSKYWLVTKNAWPYKGARAHFLLITREHIEAIEDLKPLAWSDLQKIYKKLVRENNFKGSTLLFRSGDTKITGASVNHLHAHLIVGTPRTKNTKPIKALVGFKK